MKDTIFNLTDDEILHHHIHVDNARSLIQAQLGLGAEEDGTLSGYYGGFYLIVGFSHLHPLMVFSFCRPFTSKATVNTYRALNRANISSILGSTPSIWTLAAIVFAQHTGCLRIFPPYSFSVLWIDVWPTRRKAIAPFCARNKEKLEVIS